MDKKEKILKGRFVKCQQPSKSETKPLGENRLK